MEGFTNSGVCAIIPHRRAIAEMSDDDALRLYRNAGLAEGINDVLVGKPVKHEAADAFAKS